MIALTTNINIWKTCVIGVAWKRPPYKPIPSPKKGMSRFLSAIKEENKRIIIVFLEYNIDFSRLKVTALDNNKNNKENIVIVFVRFKLTCFVNYAYKLWNESNKT